MFYILFIIIVKIQNGKASLCVLDSGVAPLEPNSVAIQFYFDLENLDRKNSCLAWYSSKKCCLTESGRDCRTMNVKGGVTTFKPRDRQTLIYVYPTLYSHDRVGYCDLILDSMCGKVKMKRIEINIPFDTRVISDKRMVRNVMKRYLGNKKKIRKCSSLDQNSLSECKPVECKCKYLDKRPFYDKVINKCVEVPECNSDPDKELPSTCYISESNSCRDLNQALTVQDIYAIKTGYGIVANNIPRRRHNIEIEIESSNASISQNLKLLYDIFTGNSPVIYEYVDFQDCITSIIKSLFGFVIGFCICVIALFFCLNLVPWFYSNRHIFKDKFKLDRDIDEKPSRVSKEIRNSLLREVIVKDIPVELRDSVVELCDRLNNNTGHNWKRRFRVANLNSEATFDLTNVDSLTTSSTSTINKDDRQNVEN